MWIDLICLFEKKSQVQNGPAFLGLEVFLDLRCIQVVDHTKQLTFWPRAFER